jgi:hypothetical protein
MMRLAGYAVGMLAYILELDLFMLEVHKVHDCNSITQVDKIDCLSGPQVIERATLFDSVDFSQNSKRDSLFIYWLQISGDI